jgi:hypothetical protein
MHCNQELKEAAKAQVDRQVPVRIQAQIDHFMRCPGCKRVYWQGSHHAKMQTLITRALAESGYQVT